MSLLWKILVFDEGTESVDIATNENIFYWTNIRKWYRITAEVLRERSGLTRGLPIGQFDWMRLDSALKNVVPDISRPKPRVSPLLSLNTSAVIRYLIWVFASHFFAGRPYHFNQTLRTANKFLNGDNRWVCFEKYWSLMKVRNQSTLLVLLILIFFNLLNLFWHTDKNICFYAEVNFWDFVRNNNSTLVATSADSVPSSYLVRITIASI
jgi:hypothetical protein